jgi:hypothetical protein
MPDGPRPAVFGQSLKRIEKSEIAHADRSGEKNAAYPIALRMAIREVFPPHWYRFLPYFLPECPE